MAEFPPKDFSPFITHAQLVAVAARWLAGTRRCAVVAAERTASYAEEYPDAIGWRPSGASILVEAKRSVADFVADLRKPHRAGPGMGRERWYLTPVGLLSGRTLPAGWGLLELRGERVHRVIEAVERGPLTEVLSAELPLLVAITRRGPGPGVKLRAPEVCSRCGIDPELPEHHGRQLYTCDRAGCGALVCSECSRNATRARVFCLKCAEARPREVIADAG